MARRALITGASGFIGRALTERLLNDGWSVIAIGRDPAHLPRATEPVGVARYEDATLADALNGRQADVIFHLAAYGVAPGQRDPDLMFDVNVAGTSAMVRAAKLVGARALVYAGSSAEYVQAPSGLAITEDYPLTTRALYGASKAAGGLWARAVAAREGVSFQWLRVFGVYGPGEAPHRLLPAIAARLARDETVDLSPGNQIRDLLYIDDVVSALVLGAEAALAGEEGPFNLCSGQPVSVHDVAIAVADALGKPRDKLKFGAIPYRADENLWLLGDGTRLMKATGFHPKFDLALGIRHFIDTFAPLQTGGAE